jgi:hypothetical protein
LIVIACFSLILPKHKEIKALEINIVLRKRDIKIRQRRNFPVETENESPDKSRFLTLHGRKGNHQSLKRADSTPVRP